MIVQNFTHKAQFDLRAQQIACVSAVAMRFVFLVEENITLCPIFFRAVLIA